MRVHGGRNDAAANDGEWDGKVSTGFTGLAGRWRRSTPSSSIITYKFTAPRKRLAVHDVDRLARLAGQKFMHRHGLDGLIASIRLSIP
jgi:hypothetical protein